MTSKGPGPTFDLNVSCAQAGISYNLFKKKIKMEKRKRFYYKNYNTKKRQFQFYDSAVYYLLSSLNSTSL